MKPPRLLREYTESLIVAVCLALVLRFFVISAYKIPTGSMLPTLKVGDFIFAYKLPYGFPIPFSGGERWSARLPERGDVVVFRYPGNANVNYVKRVVGLPGDRIAIKDKKLFINDIEAERRPLDPKIISDVPSAEMYSVYDESFGRLTANPPHTIMSSVDSKADRFGPVVVPPGQIFVLGDNRDSSDDSRYWGTVPVSHLEGRVIMVWLSLDWMNLWGGEALPHVRWERLFKKVE
jgi:signal peptidase I